MTAVDVFAPAKINLTLHVTGKRDDGYHLLDSLVVFAPVGDAVTLSAASELSLAVEGPEAAGVPTDMSNLVLRAADAINTIQGAAFTLTKHLPSASGIGGGSSDAAAAARACLALGMGGEAANPTFGPALPLDTRLKSLAAIGADIPMCLWPAPLRARGIGDEIEYTSLPPLPALLVNPRVSVPTGRVFSTLARADNPPMPEVLPSFGEASELIGWLATQRNDLEPTARAIAPVIDTVLSALRSIGGCGLARMSGSGATCFGLFETENAAEDAGIALAATHPEWWIKHGLLGDMTARALPRTR